MDSDGDGHGNPHVSILAWTFDVPAGYVTNNYGRDDYKRPVQPADTRALICLNGILACVAQANIPPG